MTVPVPAVGDQITAAYGDLVATELNTINNGAYLSYTPALTAATTNPTLGTGGATFGKYTIVGKLIVGQIAVLFGTAATNAGSGIYTVSLPNTPQRIAGSIGVGGNPVIGFGRIQCAGLLTPVQINADGHLRYFSAALNTTEITVAHNLPGAWTANDFIQLFVSYEAV